MAETTCLLHRKHVRERHFKNSLIFSQKLTRLHPPQRTYFELESWSLINQYPILSKVGKCYLTICFPNVCNLSTSLLIILKKLQFSFHFLNKANILCTISTFPFFIHMCLISTKNCTSYFLRQGCQPYSSWARSSLQNCSVWPTALLAGDEKLACHRIQGLWPCWLSIGDKIGFPPLLQTPASRHPHPDHSHHAGHGSHPSALGWIWLAMSLTVQIDLRLQVSLTPLPWILVVFHLDLIVLVDAFWRNSTAIYYDYAF